MHIAQSRTAPNRSGFTLLEVLVATALLGLVAGGAIWSLTQANNYASIARLYTGAENAAQNQIDLIMTDGPFNPQMGQVPAELTLGTTTANPGPTIYSEPNGANGQTRKVVGTMTTTVTQVTDPSVPGVTNPSLNIYSATVVVTFNFRNRTYRVQLNALRSSDV